MRVFQIVVARSGFGCTMALSMASGAVAEPEKMSEFARLTGIVWSPELAFRDVAARPRWWPPLVLIVLLSLVFHYMFNQRGGWEHFFRQQSETNTQMQKMPADQREQIMAKQIQFAPIMGYVGSVVGIPLAALVIGGVFLLVFKMFLGAALSFRQAFAITSYAMIPLVFSTAMTLVMLQLKDPSEFDLQYPTLTNIGAFLDSVNTPKWLLSLATSIDAFTLWILALLATGFSAAARKISWSTAMAYVVGTWSVYVLLKVGWAAMFG